MPTPIEFATEKQTVDGTAHRRRSCAMPTAFRKPQLDAAGKPVPFTVGYPEQRTTRATS